MAAAARIYMRRSVKSAENRGKGLGTYTSTLCLRGDGVQGTDGGHI